MAKSFSETQLLQILTRLPMLEPFTTQQAAALGVSAYQLKVLRDAGFVVTRLKGVHHVAGLVDSIDLRIACLRLVVPDGYVVVDRTAAWLWGAAMALAPGDHLEVPPICLFAPPGRRLRNKLTTSGERTLAEHDVVELDGLLVTTALRTACDLGRLEHRFQALGSMDALARVAGLTAELIGFEAQRFKGMRGVVQLRVLAPLVDPRSESQLETASRLTWHDACLPWPECQVDVPSPTGGLFHIDIGLRKRRFGLEVNGVDFHGEERREHDSARLAWLTEEQGWTILVAWGRNVYGPRADLHRVLLAAWIEHQRSPQPRVIDLSSADGRRLRHLTLTCPENGTGRRPTR